MRLRNSNMAAKIQNEGHSVYDVIKLTRTNIE